MTYLAYSTFQVYLLLHYFYLIYYFYSDEVLLASNERRQDPNTFRFIDLADSFKGQVTSACEHNTEHGVKSRDGPAFTCT